MKRLLSLLGAVAAVAIIFTLAPHDAGAAVATLDLKPLDPLSGLGLGFAGIIINQNNLTAIYTAFKTAFNTGFRDATADWPDIATEVPSTTKTEKYGWLGQYPRLREWVGDRQLKSLAAHDYSITNKKFESSVAVPRDDLEDDTYGVFTPLMQEMGFAAKTHPDELVFALLKAGFDTACYDGQYFFDTDHPVGTEETGITSVSNYQAGTGNPWFLLDASRPLKPLLFQKRRDYDFKSMIAKDDEHVFMADEYRYGVDARCNVGFGFWQTAFASKATLSTDNFNAAYAAMVALKSDEGRPLGIKPSVLVVGPSNRAAALAVIAVQKLANGADNPNYQVVQVKVVPWLD